METTVGSALPREGAAEQQGGGAALAANRARQINQLPGGIQSPKKKTMIRVG
jgi:hypothetical protein